MYKKPNRTTPKFSAPQPNRNNKVEPGHVVLAAATIYAVVKMIEVGIAIGSAGTFSWVLIF